MNPSTSPTTEENDIIGEPNVNHNVSVHLARFEISYNKTETFQIKCVMEKKTGWIFCAAPVITARCGPFSICGFWFLFLSLESFKVIKLCQILQIICAALVTSKHLKGQLVPPREWQKSVTKNEHFLKLCQEGQLGPPRSETLRTPQNCILTWRSSLNLSGRRPALA